jgi:hypothetical protein
MWLCAEQVEEMKLLGVTLDCKHIESMFVKMDRGIFDTPQSK